MSDIIIKRESHILRMQLNRPRKKNALTPAMYGAMRAALEKAGEADDTRVVYLTGSGDSFCAGNDINSFLAQPESTAATQFIRAIAGSRLPIVAAVNGVAVGIGVTMLLHCDLVYAADSARFSFPFVDLGLAPEAASSYLLPRLLGYAKAAELLLLGEPFSAAIAVDLGIVNQAVAADELDGLALATATKLAAKPPEALREARMLLRRGMMDSMGDAIDRETEILYKRLGSDEARGIMAAFMARRRGS